MLVFGKKVFMILIVGHFERKKVKKALGKTVSALKKNNADFQATQIARIKKTTFGRLECAIAIGGDGSLLRLARELKSNAPLIGIGCGERNFLMQIKQKEIEKKIEKIVHGKFSIEEKMRLEAMGDGKKLGFALNEVLLVNKGSGGLIKYCIKAKGKKIFNQGDGVIVATPTGSTGHAFSAGGKKISKGIEIVEYNTMGKKTKPIVLNENSKIEISCLDEYVDYEIVIDGQPRFNVRKNIIIKRGKNIKFVKLA